MKKVIVILLVVAPFLAGAQVPFHKGVNLTNWFQAPSAQQVQFTRFTKQDFINIKSLGCDVIRLPINLHYMTDGSPEYSIDPLFYEFMDQVVEWAEELEIHLILDNHTFDPAVDTSPDVEPILIAVWSQLAAHYQDRSDFLYYEILNEPHGITDQEWGSIQGKVISAIRQADQKHTIIVGGAGWNSFYNLQYLPHYQDDNLIYTFHFYDPFLFTHQGASWVNPSLVPLSGMPFPYQAEAMPGLPAEHEGTWIENEYYNYHQKGTVEHLKELIDIAVAFREARNVPVFCGEFGVYMPNSPASDRVYWYQEVSQYLTDQNIPWTSWDYTGGFGIFEEGDLNLFDHHLNTPLLQALDLQVPEQTPYVSQPTSEGFKIYADYIGQNLVEASHGNHELNFYATTHPNNGKYCIYWSDAEQYNHIGFNFVPDQDLSQIVHENYALDFLIRGNTPGSKIDVRFVDTKTSKTDHPWRMRFVIDESLVNWDNQWHHIHLPLKEFTEQGAWDDGWFEPEGKFNWAETDRFEIVAEHQSLYGAKFWLDNIFITDYDTARVLETNIITSLNLPDRHHQVRVFPNPAGNYLSLNYWVQSPGNVKMDILDLSGQKILSLFDQDQLPGFYQQEWFKSDSNWPETPGIYLLSFKTTSYSRVFKLMIK
ncbi:MAG: cellulase family glycosylhydrolase [Candidatus Cyclobacteriaceae bacterium M3_2C_046]